VTTPAQYLVDTSVLTRLDVQEVENGFVWMTRAGKLGVSILSELEIGYSARSAEDYRASRSRIIDHLLPVGLPARAEPRAREVQAALVERGQHRAVSVPDLLIAATAEIERLTVLHYDADFDLIGSVTGQPTEWVVPRGSID